MGWEKGRRVGRQYWTVRIKIPAMEGAGIGPGWGVGKMLGSGSSGQHLVVAVGEHAAPSALRQPATNSGDTRRCFDPLKHAAATP